MLSFILKLSLLSVFVGFNDFVWLNLLIILNTNQFRNIFELDFGSGSVVYFDVNKMFEFVWFRNNTN